MPRNENTVTPAEAAFARRDAKTVRDADPQVVKAAQDLHESILNIDKRRAEIKAAEEALAKAQYRADNAQHTDDEVLLVNAVMDGETNLRRATVALTICEAKRKAAEKALGSAKHFALMTFVQDAKARRLAAADRLDQLAAEVEAVMQEFGDATADIVSAESHGFHLPFSKSLLGMEQAAQPNMPQARYGDAERALWA